MDLMGTDILLHIFYVEVIYFRKQKKIVTFVCFANEVVCVQSQLYMDPLNQNTSEQRIPEK